jgi:hypothetical protein
VPEVSEVNTDETTQTKLPAGLEAIGWQLRED